MFAADLHPPVQYDGSWTLFGAALIGVGLLWVGAIFWITRHKKPRTAAALKQLAPKGPDMDALRAKYLVLIDEIAGQYNRRQIGIRELHLQLSQTVRMFVYEAKGIPAPKLTLTEIRRTALSSLADLIADYYPDEFDSISVGGPDQAIKSAQELVARWQ